MVAFSEGRPLLEPSSGGDLQVAYLPVADVGEPLLFLGLWKDTPVFAAEPAEPVVAPADAAFADLREAALRLPAAEAAICATAKSLFEWHRRHGFCANCGARSIVADGGWKRLCEACRVEHFPRIDPVVIMLPTYGDRCLVGRQAHWPARMYSALAGFVEPGESLEEACARELTEEAGLTCLAARYHSSQPWPFPSSLMIGLMAEVADDVVTPDPVEMHAHCWLTREEAQAVMAGAHPVVRRPSEVAIAHYLLKAFAEE